MLEGELSIVRNSHGEIHLEVRDELSGCRFVDLCIAPHNFAMALTGLACEPCSFDLSPENVGKRREVKKVLMPRPDFDASEEDLIKLTKPFLTDGWTARISDLSNSHNWRENYRVEVTMTRFVEEEEANDD